MERRIEEDVDGWPTRPIDGGYDGLRQLAAADFSGAIRANGATLFMLNGRIVGIFDGSVEAFDGASGTAHKAPHPALPLLYTMQEQGGETRGKYYTNDTPISEVDQTLSEGGFTGLLELSENVLSGDYYLVYHAGNAMSVAFIGNSGKLVTGDDAFERADDEVGIYEVQDVDVDVRDVPGLDDGGEDDSARDEVDDPAAAASGSQEGTPEGDDDDAAGSAGVGVDPTESSTARSSGDATDAADERASDAAEGDDGDPTSGRSDPARSASEPGTGGGRSATGGSSEDRDPTTADDGATPTQSVSGSQTGGSVGVADEVAAELDEERVAQEDDGDATAARDTDTAGASDRDAAEASDRGAAGASDQSTAEPVGEPEDGDERDAVVESSAETQSTSAEATSEASDRSTPSPTAGAESVEPGDRDRTDETPSADRDEQPTASSRARDRGSESVTGTDADAGASSRSGGTQTTSAAVGDATTIPSLDPDRSEAVETASQSSESTARSEPTSSGTTTANRQPTEEATEAVEETFEEEVLEREDRIDRLQQRASNLEAERDEVAAERDRLAERVETLEDENESLQAELRQLQRDVEDLETGAGAPAAAETEQSGPVALQPRAALEGTDLFVRYDSKGAATLEDAHDGTASAEEVNENLRLDLHTRFDAAEATVGDESFEQFLEATMAYRFVDWLVRKLPYEVRETGQETAMRDLYDALPEVDRVEFHGVVELSYEENGETVQAEEPFDVVVRDRMGEALFVADLNDSRDPADADMLVDLQSGATRVKDVTGALAGAFAVTRSFFDPDALETAAEATGGSLLSRDSRKSFVKVSRKRGYHLCLVEARGEDLHLNVPEL